MDTVKILDKTFKTYVSAQKIQQIVDEMANKMNKELAGKDVIFLGILNGSFIFAADLYRKINFDSQITFLKVASYEGTSSTGKVKRLIGVNESLENKTVVIIEDIIDSGITMSHIIKQLKGYEPAEIKVATFLFKPEAYQMNDTIDYIGLEIPNDFIIGYGLDYDGFGRNLENLYVIEE